MHVKEGQSAEGRGRREACMPSLSGSMPDSHAAPSSRSSRILRAWGHTAQAWPEASAHTMHACMGRTSRVLPAMAPATLCTFACEETASSTSLSKM